MSRSRRIPGWRAVAMSTSLLAGLLVAGGGPALGQPPPEDPEEVLSHFLCYRGTFPAFTAVPNVTFTDQFGSRTTAVAAPHLFCNPVRKTRRDTVTRIVDRRQHLKAYRLRTPSATDLRLVMDSNQFGVDQLLTIEDTPTRVLVPTRKAPHEAPVGLDHFTCYNVLDGKAIDRRVRLRDQFTSITTRVGRPKLHCNPTVKVHAPNPPTVIQHPYAHLACYGIRSRRLDPAQGRRTGNQFERARVRAEVAVMLCVPSTNAVVPFD